MLKEPKHFENYIISLKHLYRYMLIKIYKYLQLLIFLLTTTKTLNKGN